MAKRLLDRVTGDFKFAIWLVAAMAIAVRLASLSVSDAPVGEADATIRVFYSLNWRDSPFVFCPTTWPPLQFYLYGLALAIYADPINTPLLVNIFFAGLLVVVMGYLVRLLTRDAEAGLFAGIITALYPLAIRFSVIAVPEVILNFLIFLTLLFLLRAGAGQRGQLQNRYVIPAAVAMGAANWTHMPAWFLTPLFSLLLWGRWRQYLAFVAISAVPVVVFVLHWQDMYDGLIDGWMTFTAAPDFDPTTFSRIRQLLYYPALLVETLSPALVLMGVFGLLWVVERKPYNWKLQLFPLLCLLALIPPYLFFVYAWDRMKPKEALLLGLLVIPYAAVGLTKLKSMVRGHIAKWIVVGTALGMLVVIPYNWKFGSRGGIFPIPRTAPEYRQSARWLNENVEPNDSIVFDHLPFWSDYYLALAARRMPHQVFLALDTFSPAILPRLCKFVAEHQPKFLVLSKQLSTVSAALELRCNPAGCPEATWEPALQVNLSKEFETEHVVIYKISH